MARTEFDPALKSSVDASTSNSSLSFSSQTMLSFLKERVSGFPFRDLEKKGGKSDRGLEWYLTGDFSLAQKREAIDIWYAEVLDKDPSEPLDEKRVADLLSTATSVYKDKNTQEELKEVIWEYMDVSVLERVSNESSKQRWGEEASEVALHAYCTFMTIDRLYGKEKGRELHRKITQELVREQALDQTLEKLAKDVTAQGRGGVIHLGGKGALLAQTVAKEAFTATIQEEKARGILAPYYREAVLATHTDDPQLDPDENFYTIEETMAQASRVKGAPRGEGRELTVFGKVNKKGEISQFYGTPNVGWHIGAALGYADKLRLEAIRKEGIMYEKPERVDAYRKIQLDAVGSVIFIGLGDGAYPQMNAHLERAKTAQAPAVCFIENNQIAIGVEQNEVIADGKLWKKGHGRGIPGIRIEENDVDGLFMAIRCAVQWANADAGPTIIEAMTRRNEPHSTQHGDPGTIALAHKARQILTRLRERLAVDHPASKVINNLIEEAIRPGNVVNQIVLRDKYLEMVQNKRVLDAQAHKEWIELMDSISDPAEVYLQHVQKKGYVEDSEVHEWKEKAEKRMQEARDEVLKRQRPLVEEATFHIRMATPRVEAPYLHEKITAKNPEALRKAFEDSMSRNRNVLVFGPDVIKGFAIHGKKLGYEGGYYGQERGLHEQFGKDPRRINNTEIDEEGVAAYLLGMTTTPTHPDALKNAVRVTFDTQYTDYGKHGISAIKTLADLYYTTNGQATRTFGMVSFAGAVYGGGPRHSQEGVSDFYQLPSNVDIAYPTTPEMTYKVGRYLMEQNPNPWVLMVSKSSEDMAFQETFEIGTGYHEPGKGRVAREGKGMRIIGYGPMVGKAVRAIEGDQTGELKDTGVWEPVWIRPFDTKGLREFLGDGDEPIVIASPEPIGKKSVDPEQDDHKEELTQGFSAQIHDFIRRDPTLKDRDVHIIGAEPIPAIPVDKAQVDAIIPNESELRRRLIELQKAA